MAKETVKEVNNQPWTEIKKNYQLLEYTKNTKKLNHKEPHNSNSKWTNQMNRQF